MKKNKNCIKPNTVVKLAQGQKVTERSRAQIMLIYETSSSSSDQPYKPCLSVSNVRRFDGLNILRHVLFSVMICFVSEHYLSSWPFYDLVTLRQHRLRSLVRRITGANDAVNLCSLCSQKRRSTPCGQQWPFRLLTRSRSLYVITVPSVVCLTVTMVHPSQPVEILGIFSSPSGTLAIDWHSRRGI